MEFYCFYIIFLQLSFNTFFLVTEKLFDAMYKGTFRMKMKRISFENKKKKTPFFLLKTRAIECRSCGGDNALSRLANPRAISNLFFASTFTCTARNYKFKEHHLESFSNNKKKKRPLLFSNRENLFIFLFWEIGSSFFYYYNFLKSKMNT